MDPQLPSATADSVDEQDRIAILQMLTLTIEQRLDYFADEAEFDSAPVEWIDG